MLKIYLPAYRRFECLAGNCSENCCKVFRIIYFNWEKEQFDSKPEWQDVDGNGSALTRFLVNEGGESCLSKDEHGCCVFLTGDGLCGLQLRHGPMALPSVCRTYPRLITGLADRIEYALDTCCVQVLRLIRDWTPGDFEFVGGDAPTDENFLVRKQAMALLSDKSLDFDRALEQISKLYEFEWPGFDFCFEEPQLDFLRKAIAATIWAYAIPYQGHHNHPRSMVAIMEFLVGYLEQLAKSGISEWDGLSIDFSRALSAYVKRVGFDDEIEGRYTDVSKD